jgi:hypothetical protein
MLFPTITAIFSDKKHPFFPFVEIWLEVSSFAPG